MLDADGAAVVERERVGEVIEAARRRIQSEEAKRSQFESGQLLTAREVLRFSFGVSSAASARARTARSS